jgi:hypothetical protein
MVGRRPLDLALWADHSPAAWQLGVASSRAGFLVRKWHLLGEVVTVENRMAQFVGFGMG